MPAKRYVILDANPAASGNDDFLFLGLKEQGFARGCPMLFGGSADAKDGAPNAKDFSLKVIKREVFEETKQHIEVEQVTRYKVFPNDLVIYWSKDFTHDGTVKVGGEFAWIRKVSKGKLKAHVGKPKDTFASTLFGMVADKKIDPTDSEYDEYIGSDTLTALHAYCKEKIK